VQRDSIAAQRLNGTCPDVVCAAVGENDRAPLAAPDAGD
jgi:hypothetical protein